MDTAWLGDEPLLAAQTAERLAWSESSPLGSRRDALYIRDAAVRLALREGVRQEHIAAELRICLSDVRRIAAMRVESIPY